MAKGVHAVLATGRDAGSHKRHLPNRLVSNLNQLDPASSVRSFSTHFKAALPQRRAGNGHCGRRGPTRRPRPAAGGHNIRKRPPARDRRG